MIERCDRLPALAEVEAALPRFTGAIEQVPPAYSALKVDGQRAYDRRAAGERVELTTRAVTVFALEILTVGEGEATLAPTSARVRTSAPWQGTSRAPWEAVGHVTYLRRIKAGPFHENQAISLDTLNEIGKGARLEDHLLPLEAGLDGIPAHELDRTAAQAARQGRVLSDQALPDGLFLARCAGVPVALMETEGGTAKVVRGFNFPDAVKD